MTKYLLTLLLLIFHLNSSAQAEISNDTIFEELNEIYNDDENSKTDYFKPKKLVTIDDSHRFRVKQLIAPVGFIALGSFALKMPKFKGVNDTIQSSIRGKQKFRIDDVIQYLPTVAPYALRLCGIKGIHNYIDMTIILATSELIMATTVSIVKNSVHSMRPDGTTANSFPSGHTATAFVGAEFLRKEYSHVSPWIGWAGYFVATSTGFLRMYNNRHYPMDVVTGAGIGILSTKVAYWVYPYMQRLFFGKNHSCKSTAISAIPYYNPDDKSFGIGCVVNL